MSEGLFRPWLISLNCVTEQFWHRSADAHMLD